MSNAHRTLTLDNLFIFRVLKECLFQNSHMGVRSGTDCYPNFADWKTENKNNFSRFAWLDFAGTDFFLWSKLGLFSFKENKTSFLHLVFLHSFCC